MTGKKLACPCEFEPQTYALEAVKVSLNNKLDNGIKLLKSGVQYTPRILVSSGTAWIWRGIRRRLDGSAS